MTIKRKYLVVLPANLTDKLWCDTWNGYNTCDWVVRCNDKIMVFDTPEAAEEYKRVNMGEWAKGRRTAVIAWEEEDEERKND